MAGPKVVRPVATRFSCEPGRSRTRGLPMWPRDLRLARALTKYIVRGPPGNEGARHLRLRNVQMFPVCNSRRRHRCRGLPLGGQADSRSGSREQSRRGPSRRSRRARSPDAARRPAAERARQIERGARVRRAWLAGLATPNRNRFATPGSSSEVIRIRSRIRGATVVAYRSECAARPPRQHSARPSEVGGLIRSCSTYG